MSIHGDGRLAGNNKINKIAASKEIKHENRYEERQHERMYKMPKKQGDDTHWREFSTNPQTEDDIRAELLRDPYGVCMTWICENSVLSEEFIEELHYLTSGIFNKDTYTYDNVKLLIEFDNEIIPDDRKKVCQKIYNAKHNEAKRSKLNKNLVKYIAFPDSVLKYFFSNNKKGVITDRIDWKAIDQWQTLSDEFRERHKEELSFKPYSLERVDVPAGAFSEHIPGSCNKKPKS